ncbi:MULTISPECIES: Rieske 2Fe-2S domain-containing protein [unclassified Cupriavidus]|uniref:Rieske 2Fe-2S domain-containing protein n=1 Tax=unclassified Cupriavidus TaxID=2640874 RepID=UPI001AE1A4C8|nr:MULTISPECIES: Rieske 2Fe-2S domain-containing protein [unclassified Cupriavidus]MBP0633440.1 Rieske 2Fe-2S domain-containing protein [Cupriavidus sp. AcVe19-1a]MBP0640087.1 Rieske 2Fe-2S domain-containing protein [Cupriavidus sp. AcVe19-6a]
MHKDTKNFQKVSTLDELWEGDMAEVVVDGHVIVLVRPRSGTPRAFQGICPHQDIPLAEGNFDGHVLMCRAHQWTFDANTGKGINPSGSRLAEYAVRVDGDDILIAVEGVEPPFANC